MIAGAGLTALLLIAILLVTFRGPLTRMIPAVAAAYAAVGLSAGPPGLVIEGVKAEPGFAFGRPVLSVSGQIHNVGRHAQDAPALSIRLLDLSGKALAAKTARPEDPQVPAGARRYFRVAFEDPPKGFHDLDVAFTTGRTPSRPAKAGPMAAPAAPVPPPEEARPLPPDSPDALPNHG